MRAARLLLSFLVVSLLSLGALIASEALSRRAGAGKGGHVL